MSMVSISDMCIGMSVCVIMVMAMVMIMPY